MSDFDLQCFLSYMELLKEYNRTKSKKKKEELIRKMECLKVGLMPINLGGHGNE